MAEEQTNLSDILESTRDYELNKRNFNVISKILETNSTITSADINKLIALCIKQLSKKNTVSIQCLKIVCLLLKRLERENRTSTDLVPLLLAISKTLKNNVNVSNIDAVKALCFEILLLFPPDALKLAAVNNSSEFYTIVQLYCLESTPVLAIQSITLIFNVLQTLPPSDCTNFVENGIDTWFSKLIPMVFELCKQGTNEDIETAFSCLELLTEILQSYDCIDNKHWMQFFEHSASRYPKIIMELLNNNKDYWHRLWRICLKLLNYKVTLVTPSVPAPINALLAVQEKAFKMDNKKRCAAFECWKELIDVFSTMETTEKQIKLLLVPLLASNAKVAETSVTKIKTWWSFILKFHQKLPGLEMRAIIIQFLNLCFGPPTPKPNFAISGMISPETKKLSIEMFTNILGHYKCTGCTSSQLCNVNLMLSTHFETQWKTLVYFLKMAIKTSIELNEEVVKKQIACAWKSFIFNMSPYSEARDILSSLLVTLQHLIQECRYEVSDTVINTLIPCFFQKEEMMNTLLVNNNEASTKILSILLDTSNNNFYSSCDINDTLKSIKTYTDYVVSKEKQKPVGSLEDALINHLPTMECGLIVWMAYVESIMEQKYYSSPQVLSDVISWPLPLDIRSNREKYVSTWLTFHAALTAKPKEVNKKVITTVNNKILFFFYEQKNINTMLSLAAVISLIKQYFADKGDKLQKQAQQVLKILKKQLNCENFTPTLYVELINSMILISNVFIKSVDVVGAKHFFTSLNDFLKIIPKVHDSMKEKNTELENCLESLLRSLYDLFKKNEYSMLTPLAIEGTKDAAAYFIEKNCFTNNFISILKTYEENIHEIKEFLEKLTSNKSTLKDAFKTPNNNESSTKSKKRNTPNIVNTVVENGEEFVVVNSNWKFNPKRLTDNQKEKLQRKRPDIPALYQDLSQSQDEFKLSAWKSDSTEISLSSKSTSVSGSDSNVTSILKNVQASGFSPKIIENITNEVDPLKSGTGNKSCENKSKADALNKQTKSPRMTLKDRVFRNVRNLMENEVSSCSVVSEKRIEHQNTSDLNVTKEFHSKSSERPLRAIKTPKKFNDSKIFGLRKRRHSLYNNNAQFAKDELELKNVERDTKLDSNTSDNNKIVTEITNKVHMPAETTSENNITDESTETAKEISSMIKHGNSHDSKKRKRSKELEVTSSHILNDSNSLLPRVELTPIKPNSASKTSKVVARIEKKLAIDTVQGHPNLSINLDLNTPLSTRQKHRVADKKINKDKIKLKSNISDEYSLCIQDSELDIAISQDIIESSQDSTATVTSINSTKVTKKCPIVLLEKITPPKSQDNLQFSQQPHESSENLSINKIDDNLSRQVNLTEEMDTEPMDATANFINKIDCSESPTPLTVPKSDQIYKEQDNTTQNTANADTLPTDNNFSVEIIKEEINEKRVSVEIVKEEINEDNKITLVDKDDYYEITSQVSNNLTTIETPNKTVSVQNNDPGFKTLSLEYIQSQDVTSSPFKNAEQRKKVSLNNTQEISPIKKIMSPVSGITKPCSQTNDDYEIIPLTSSVQASGEPLDVKLQFPSQVYESNERPNIKKIDDNLCHQVNLTEDIDTEPMDAGAHFNNNSECMETQSLTVPGNEHFYNGHNRTQNTSNADTLQTNPSFSVDINKRDINEKSIKEIGGFTALITNDSTFAKTPNNSMSVSNKDSRVIIQSIEYISAQDDASSPFKDEEQRKKDFLNNTQEISPIKVMSPVREERTPSPETSGDYEIIPLTSPVQANGEPIDINSPEIFTEDKISPDKRDLSPPREGIISFNASPSSALSLKKNRPQVRHSGRGAQILGLCVPENCVERTEELDELKKTSSARKNLKTLYNSEHNDSSDDTEDGEQFLKLKRNLPPADCSPAGPILKRKHADIAEEATPSPACKRKRVSFHDPPVSTTMCVKKYLESGAVRSPQNSASKRQERIQKHSLVQTYKSQRRLDEELSKAKDVFISCLDAGSEDTPVTLDQTPIAEVVKISELNSTDPICPQLVGCNDPIEKIASELSSPAMKSLLVKEFEGKIDTVGDLAKLTELDVNRLCIKAPKIEVAKKVLNDYLDVKGKESIEEMEIAVNEEVMNVEEVNKEKVLETFNAEMQTEERQVSCNSAQTDGNIILESELLTHIQNLDDKSLDAVYKVIRQRRMETIKSLQELDADKKLLVYNTYLESKDLMSVCVDVLSKAVFDKP